MISRLALTLSFGVVLTYGAHAAEKPKSTKKHTTLGLYLTAAEVHKKITTNKKVLFIDVRTRAEVNFLGMPSQADANIPYMVMPEFY